MLPSYSIISLISAQSHNYQKFCPQRRCLFCPISHLPHAVSLSMKLYFLSNYVHDRYLNTKGLNIASFLPISKRHYPISSNSLTDFCYSSSSTGSIRIHPVPSVLQLVLSKFGLFGSNISKTGGYVAPLRTSDSLFFW